MAIDISGTEYVGEKYWEDLLRSIALAPGEAIKPGKLQGLFGGKGLRSGVAGLLGWMALSKTINALNLSAQQRLQRQAIRTKASLATPESLYYEAALPGALAEEEQARQMMLSQIAGGIIGPSLARGERSIGGS